MMKPNWNKKLAYRLACGILAVALTASFAGCGTAKNTASEDEVTGGENDITAASKEKTFEELDLPKLDIKSDKVTYLCWQDPAMLENPNNFFYQVNLLMDKYYKCKLEFITTTYEQLPIRAAQMVLSGQSPDLIMYKPSDDPGFIRNNIVQPLNDYIDLNNKWFKNYKDVLEYYAINGKYYYTTTGYPANNGIVYYWKNKFTDIGEKTPWELYKEDKWTWSKFRELAKKLTVDSDGDGTPESYGCNVDAVYMYMSCGEDFIKIQEDGTYTNNMKSAAVSKAMLFLQAIGKSGDNVNGGDFNKETSAMLWNERWMISSFRDQYAKGTIEIAPSPKMDGADKYYVPGRIETDWFAAGAPNPGGAISYIVCTNLMGRDPFYKEQWSKIDSKLNNYSDELNARIDEISNDKKFVPIVNHMQGVGNWDSTGMWNMLDEVSKWGTPWTTCLETYYAKFQAEIDAANKQS